MKIPKICERVKCIYKHVNDEYEDDDAESEEENIEQEETENNI
jgi:hypothetical protein